MSFPLYSLNIASVEVFHYFPNLPNYIITTIAIFGPTIGYIDQLNRMIKTCLIDGFSLDIALIMLFTNTLRFFYWSFEPYEVYLLGQSIALFVIQLILSLFSFIFAGSGTFSTKEKDGFSYIVRYFQDFPTKIQNYSFQKLAYYIKIHQCQNLIDYCISLVLYLILIFLSFAFLIFFYGLKRAYYTFLLTANLVDPIVSLPLYHRVVTLHKIQGVSVILIVQTIAGDLLKLVLFIVGNSGWTFVLGAMIQTCLDLTTSASFFIQRRSMESDELEINNYDSNENLDI